MVWSFCSVWDSMGNTKVSEIFFLYLEKLVWRASFNHLEHGLGMFYVVSLAGNARIFEDKARPLEHLKCLLFRTLFLWARIWGCTNCTAVADFLISISFSSWSSIVQSVHHREHDVQFSSIKVLLLIKKKEYSFHNHIWEFLKNEMEVHTLFESLSRRERRGMDHWYLKFFI